MKFTKKYKMKLILKKKVLNKLNLLIYNEVNLMNENTVEKEFY